MFGLEIIKLLFYVIIIAFIVYYYGVFMDTKFGKFMFTSSKWITWPFRKVGSLIYNAATK